MTLNLGSGPPLKDFSPWLKDEAERHARILEVVERNCVTEGLPPFTQEFRRHLLHQLQAISRKPTPSRSSALYDCVNERLPHG